VWHAEDSRFFQGRSFRSLEHPRRADDRRSFDDMDVTTERVIGKAPVEHGAPLG
jgi:hypothetical protein